MKIQVIKSRRQSVSIKINEIGEIFVLCPIGFSNEKIEKLLIEKKQWIDKILSEIEIKKTTYKDFFKYDKLLFLGNEYNINKEGQTEIQPYGKIVIRKKQTIESALKLWLKKISQQIIHNILTELSQLTGITYSNLKIISARKKWGSCDSRKEIRINFRLIMLDYNCIKYVCIHELCHVRHLNHSKNFWQLVEKYCPNYKTIKKKLKANSFCLELF